MNQNHQPIRQISVLLTFVVSVLVVLVSLTASFTLVSSTTEHFGVGLIMGVFLCLGGSTVIVPVMGLAFFVIWFLIRKTSIRPKVKAGILIAPALVISLIALSVGVSSTSPASRFETEIIRPKPASVANIAVDGYSAFLARRWLFSFDIAPEEFSRLLSLNAFTNLVAYDYLAKLTNYTSRKLPALESPEFYGWSNGDGVPSLWRNIVVNSNHTQVYYTVGYQN